MKRCNPYLFRLPSKSGAPPTPVLHLALSTAWKSRGLDTNLSINWPLRAAVLPGFGTKRRVTGGISTKGRLGIPFGLPGRRKKRQGGDLRRLPASLIHNLYCSHSFKTSRWTERHGFRCTILKIIL